MAREWSTTAIIGNDGAVRLQLPDWFPVGWAQVVVEYEGDRVVRLTVRPQARDEAPDARTGEPIANAG